MKIQTDDLKNFLNEEDIKTTRSDLLRFSVFGTLPVVAVFPRTYEQVSSVLRYCNEKGLSVIPFGSGTKIRRGNIPVSFDIALSLQKLNRIIEHNEPDFILTVQSGAKFTDIQDFLKEKNQFIAIDPPLSGDGATIGGIISTNDYGPSRLRYGTSREQIIEMKAVRADGEIIKGGAKVVKNVAGYDIHKLLVGAMGTLGVVVEASLRLYPLPENSLTFICGLTDIDDLRSRVDKILNADLVLSALEIINISLASDIFRLVGLRPINFEHTLVLRIENVSKAVKEQMEIVKSLLNNESIEGAVIENDNPIWDHIRNFPYLSNNNKVISKISVLISDIPRVLDYIQEFTENLDVRIHSSARAGNGVVQLLIEGENKDLNISVDLLRSFLTTIKGSIVYQHVPEDFGKFNAWGDMGSSHNLMKALKKNFDPNNILNPGRMISI